MKYWLQLSFSLPEDSESNDDVDVIETVGEDIWEVLVSNAYSVRVGVNPLAQVKDLRQRVIDLQESGFLATAHLGEF